LTRRAYAEVPSLERCDSCGLVWLRERASESQYEGAFLTDSGYYAAYFARAGQWRHEARLRLEWLLQHARPSSLLEVGAAGGFFAEAARGAGIDVLGIEPSADGSRFARDELGVPVLTGTFEDVDLTGPFDAVCAFHVLEHVQDPQSFVARARDLLSTGGWLALEVPNIDSARAHRDGPGWFNLVPEYHRWHFSPQTLARLVEGAGLVVESVDTVFPRHYFRLRRIATMPGLRSIMADVRCNPTPRRTHPTAGDYLRLLARAR
jgi:2-polyprenyl-3-methyl-5-hydroxy-6-metoxy-1,4-benzoquinol methylase